MKLVVQGEGLASLALNELAGLCGASGHERIGEHAFRLHDADPDTRPAVAAWCGERRLDYGFVPAGRRDRKS
ncbi:MAG: DUF4072 domain-containing protein, partial [Zoogloea sp.]|nr:DUF4072 domain-containing protein [Zoogloea sp.]